MANQDLQGELYGFLYSGPNKVCLANLPTEDGYRIVLTPISGSGPGGWDNTFYLVPHANEIDGAYNWNDVNSTDHDGCYDPPMTERHTGSINDGTEHHCLVAGRYQMALQLASTTIQTVDLDYVQPLASILDGWNGGNGRLVTLANENYAASGYGAGDHIVIFNIGAAVPDVAVNEGFEADAPGTDATLRGWAPMPSAGLVVATNEALRVDVGQTTAPGTLDQPFSVLHRITWESGVSTGWFYSTIGYNHTRSHIYGGAPRCAALVHEVALPGDIHSTGVSVPSARRFSRTVDVGGGCGLPHPDLQIQSITNPGVLPSPGTASLTVNVRNGGNGSSSGGVLRAYLSTTPTLSGTPTQIGQTTLGTINATTTTPVTFTITVPSGVNGSRYIVVVADADRQVAELQEGNNQGSLAVSVGNLPDLQVTGFSYPSTVPLYPSAAVSAQVNYRNFGNVATGSTTWTGAWALSTDNVYGPGDVVMGTFAVSTSLAPYQQLGDAGLRALFFAPPPGTIPGQYYLVAKLDSTNVIAESNESNNGGAGAQFTITANGDLVIDSVMGPSSIGQGATVTVPVYVRNAGSDPAPPAQVRVYLSTDNVYQTSDLQIGTLTDGAGMTTGIKRTENVSVTIPAGQATGSYYVIARVDADSTIYESNEGNNTRVRVGQVSIINPTFPDLIINTLIHQIDSAFSGQSYTWVKGTIKNTGTATAASGFQGRLYLSTDATWDASDVVVGTLTFGSLAPNATASLATVATVPNVGDGTYYLIYRVDYTNVVAESNETNNTGVVAGTVWVQGLP